MFRTFLTSLCLATALFAALPLGAAPRSKSKPKRLTKREQLDRDLRQYYVKLDQRLFGEKDYRAVEKLLRKVEKDDSLRPLIISLLAQYQRRMEKEPGRGLEVLAPDVLGRTNGRAWVQAHRKADSVVQAKYHKAVLRAHSDRTDPPEKPSGLAHPFPDQQMKITEQNIECALEVARCLMAMGEIQQALKVIDTQGRQFRREGRVLSYECLGDLQLRMQLFKEAVGAYQMGLKLLNSLKPTEGFDAWQKLLLARLQRKLAEAKRLWDMDRLGAGYIAYRDAEHKRRKEKAYLQAIMAYDRIIWKFPKTVYAEASKCYRIKCFLELSHYKALPKSATKALAAVAKKRDETENLVRLAKKYKVPKPSIAEFEAEVKQHEKKIADIKALPYGKKALEAAKESARAFVKENLFGLYRPETLVDIANYAFERELDPERADKYYRQAWQVMEKAPAADASLARYAIPAKAAKVARPQQNPTQTSHFGHIKRVEDVGIGVVLNRRTAPWYLNRLRAKAVMPIGFLCFYRKKNDEAKTWYKLIPKYDKKTRELDQTGQWNDLQRLNWAADNGYFHAFPQELKLYKPRQRFAILVADFYHCTERFEKSIALAKRMLANEFGKLSSKQRDYPLYLIASSLFYLKGRKESFLAYEKVLEKRDGTYTEDRAMHDAATVSGFIRDTKLHHRGHAYLKELIKSRNKNPWVYRAKIRYGLRMFHVGKEKEGIRVLRSIGKDSDGHNELAEFYIKEYFEEKEEKARKMAEKK